MWIKKINRDGFSDVLMSQHINGARQCQYAEAFPKDPILKDELQLIWGSEPRHLGELPVIILVADGHLTDFLAWASTYFPGYQPLTAYTRVLELKTLSMLDARTHSPSLQGIEAACGGLIIGEALTLAGDQMNPDLLPVVACASTVSYSLARSLAIGATRDEFDKICEKWTLARKLAAEAPRQLVVEDIKRIWQSVGCLRYGLDWSSPQRNGLVYRIARACREIRETGQVSADLWAALTDGRHEFTLAQQKMEGPREDRVRYFDQLTSTGLIFALEDKFTAAFVLGYLASLIGPGSMSHFQLLARSIKEAPTVLMWYGLCAGLNKKSDLLSAFNALGRRLLKNLDMPESIFVGPGADISVAEMEVLLAEETRPASFRSFSPSHIMVELTPMVYTYVHARRPDSHKQLGLFSTTAQDAPHKLLSELGVLLEKSLVVHSSLSDILGGSSRPGSLPKMKRKKQRRS